MGGTDFSTRPYTLDDTVDHLGGKDLNLTSFSLQQEDFKLKVNNKIFLSLPIIPNKQLCQCGLLHLFTPLTTTWQDEMKGNLI